MNTAFGLQFWGVVQVPLGAITVMRYSGEPQPVALAVQVTVVPIACGEAGLGANATPVHGVLVR